MMAEPIPLLILGGNGRIGRSLRAQTAAFAAQGLRPIWQTRAGAPGFLHWDIEAQPCPPVAASGVVLCLAGVIRGTADALAQNEALAMAACRAAAAQGARHVFLASSAAVYGPSDLPLTEQTVPAPLGAYGRAKLAMERAALGWHQPTGPGLTILRIGNIAGFDALLGGQQDGQQAVLDPIAGQSGGPVRSYIGPLSLGSVLVQLAGLAAAGQPLPKILNIAVAPPVRMGDLLDAARVDWRYGPINPAALARVELAVDLLGSLVDLPPKAAQAATMVAEWRGLAE
jgi:nucleoside-diphosphate-sugar epimerase